MYPILDINCKDSLCAARVHSYHVSYRAGTRIGGIHTLGILKKEHTHSVKVNLIIDNLLKKSYIIVQMKGTHDWYNKISKRFTYTWNIQDID